MYGWVSTDLVGNKTEVKCANMRHLDKIGRDEYIENESRNKHPSHNFNVTGMLKGKRRAPASNIFSHAPHYQKHHSVNRIHENR